MFLAHDFITPSKVIFLDSIQAKGECSCSLRLLGKKKTGPGRIRCRISTMQESIYMRHLCSAQQVMKSCQTCYYTVVTSPLRGCWWSANEVSALWTKIEGQFLESYIPHMCFGLLYTVFYSIISVELWLWAIGICLPQQNNSDDSSIHCSC